MDVMQATIAKVADSANESFANFYNIYFIFFMKVSYVCREVLMSKVGYFHEQNSITSRMKETPTKQLSLEMTVTSRTAGSSMGGKCRQRDPGMSDGTSLHGAKAADWAAKQSASLESCDGEYGPHSHHIQLERVSNCLAYWASPSSTNIAGTHTRAHEDQGRRGRNDT